MHLACDPRALGGRGEPALLVALEFQPRGPLVQGGEQRPALADRDAEHSRGGRQAREADPDLQRLRRRPAQRGHDRASLHRAGGEEYFRGSPSSATQYREIRTAASASCGAASSHWASATSAIVPKQSIGLSRRSSNGAHRATQKPTAIVSRRCWLARPTMLSAAVARQIARSLANGYRALNLLSRSARWVSQVEAGSGAGHGHACVHIGGFAGRGSPTRAPVAPILSPLIELGVDE